MDTSERLEDRTTRLTVATDRLARTATVAGVVPALLVGLVLFLVEPVVGLVVAVVLAAAWVLLVRRRISGASAVVLGGLPTRPLGPDEAPRLMNVLEGLFLTCGVDAPEIEVVDASAGRPEALNAAVVVSGDQVRLVVTPGVIEGLDRMQLEGLLAQLLGRVRDGSAAYTTLVLSLLGAGTRSERHLDVALGDQRAVRADLLAVDLTRYPPGLRAALEAMVQCGTEVPAASARSRDCWVAPIGPTVSAADRTSGSADLPAPPLELRIAVLAEL